MTTPTSTQFEVHTVADASAPAGDTTVIPAGVFQFHLDVPDSEIEVRLERWENSQWHCVLGLTADPSHIGPRSLHPEPFRLPACGVRLVVPVSKYSSGVSATLTQIGV